MIKVSLTSDKPLFFRVVFLKLLDVRITISLVVLHTLGEKFYKNINVCYVLYFVFNVCILLRIFGKIILYLANSALSIIENQIDRSVSN